jgi:hypothetical protein
MPSVFRKGDMKEYQLMKCRYGRDRFYRSVNIQQVEILENVRMTVSLPGSLGLFQHHPQPLFPCLPHCPILLRAKSLEAAELSSMLRIQG